MTDITSIRVLIPTKQKLDYYRKELMKQEGRTVSYDFLIQTIIMELETKDER